ncbi:MAG: hypothetical protein E7554_01280 [Ruminococcaceae bacterium]|nr:hypothetical protein [Oscillospiraceae bacterium]
MSEKNSSIFGFNSDDVRSGAVEMPTESGEEAAEKIRRKPVGRWVYVLAVAVVSLIAAVMLISSFVDRVNDGLVMELQTGDIMPSNKADGLYTGSYSASDMGASVSVDVAGGYIISITLDSYAGIDTERVLTVFDAIIAAQSLETGDDSIGTQPTDKILLLAVQDALNGGGVQ